ncbi:MAG: NnrU protein [Rhodospirillaceae bacterium]|nr:NnrU protein [Rhodospirillaceae bacterium]
MISGIEGMFLAVITFVGSHFVLGHPNIRALVVDRFGENGFKTIFTLVAAAALFWVLAAYTAAPHVEIWRPPDWSNWIPNLVVPVSAILLVAGSTVTNPTATGQDEGLADNPRPASGILTVTRHPGLWAVGLWALAHMAANGDAAGVLLFGGIAVLCFGGMSAIDTKRRVTHGADWAPFELTTSVVPFFAIVQERTTFDWSGIGWKRVAGGLVLWAILWVAHPFFIGVKPSAF